MTILQKYANFYSNIAEKNKFLLTSWQNACYFTQFNLSFSSFLMPFTHCLNKANYFFVFGKIFF